MKPAAAANSQRPWAFLGPLATLPKSAVAAAIVCAAALLIRIPHFGDPTFMIDEQFYLLVGDRMLHGALPYVDIWDRKPIGLFLIYAAIRLLGGAGFWQYHTVAAIFAAATAFIVYRIARPIAGQWAATFAGILYLLWIEIAEGGGGQSPIFYNLFVAGAAWAILGAGNSSDPRRFATRSFLAMALMGIAIQIKYTVVAEGLCFGLLLSAWSLKRLPLRTALVRIVLLAATALLPTILAVAYYAAIGEFHAFWFANFTSIFLRAPTDPIDLAYRTRMMTLRLIPLTFCIGVGMLYLWRDRSARTSRWRLVMLTWSAAAIVGLFEIGTLFSHYILPVFLPLTPASAPAFRRWPAGPALAFFVALLPAQSLDWPDFTRTRRHQTEIANLAALIPPEVNRGCLQMFDGPPILPYLSNACSLSPYVFPDHLSAAFEAGAIGVDPAQELRRLLARHPLAITIGETDIRPPNPVTFAIMRAALQRDYRLAGRSPFDGRYIDIYVRR